MVSKEIEKLRKYFGYFVIYRGNKHTFLGMDVAITEDEKVEIETKHRVIEAIQLFKKIEGNVEEDV